MKGATKADDLDDAAADVSIHAPMKGATLDAVGDWLRLRFQSTLP